MAAPEDFDRSVFINCPFDPEFEPILQAILFCIIFLGLRPRISSERHDSAESRLEKIVELIESAKYSIHDLSRCQATKRGEAFRLNMPFELGIDYACRRYVNDERGQKKIMILEERAHRYQAALSDIAGCDIKFHGASFEKAVRQVRNWLVTEAGCRRDGASRILGKYVDFQGWHYNQQLVAGFSEEDIQDYQTSELLMSMNEWMAAGQPV